MNKFHKLYFHRLGTAQSADMLVYERPDQKDWGFGGSVTDDGRYLIISVSEGTDPKNRVFYQDLPTPDAPVVELLMDFDASYDFIDNDGPVFWFKTDLDAPRGRVIAIDITQPARANWKEIIPQSADTLQGVSVVNQQFICQLSQGRAQRGEDFRPGRQTRCATWRCPASAPRAASAASAADTETFYSLHQLHHARDDLSLRSADRPKHRVPRSRRWISTPAAYETKQVFYPSKDGTRVPMFIAHKRGLKLDGQNPTLLYGYGGFNISLTPGFSVSRAAWMEMGGVYALANLRGGGEYGEDWHQAGTKLRKQNVFDDFIAAAEWLIANHYTSPRKLAIQGGSNGGLLVGACMTQRPDLFGAALPAVGVMDMLRFHKFTIGWAWSSDYGSAGQRGRVQGAVRLFALPQSQTRRALSRDADHHGGPRRPRGAGAQLQVRRPAAGVSARSQSRADPHRNQGRPRRGQTHHEADRGENR